MLMRKLSLLVMLVALFTFSLVPAVAQEDVGPGSTVTILVVICEDQAVVNFSGTMQPGFDLYYQIYAGSQGTGEALTSLRRLQVSGEYSVSERVNYREGVTIAAGGIGSAYVAIARAGAPDSTVYTEFVDDIQDGCADPQFGIGEGLDAGDATAPTTTTQPSSILSPFGGVINPGYIPPEKPLVVVGPREEFVRPRQETPGIIFAECNAFPVAEPGVLYDTDQIVIFWSWFAATPELVQEHIDNVNYSVTYYGVLPLPEPITRTQIEQRGGDYWVFYYSRLGNLRPGRYYIQYRAWWDQPISDGYANYGPGTGNELEANGCGFQILRNLEDRDVQYSAWPFQFLGN